MWEAGGPSRSQRDLSEVNVPFQVIMDSSWDVCLGRFAVSSPANLASSEEFVSLLNHGECRCIKMTKLAGIGDKVAGVFKVGLFLIESLFIFLSASSHCERITCFPIFPFSSL